MPKENLQVDIANDINISLKLQFKSEMLASLFIVRYFRVPYLKCFIYSVDLEVSSKLAKVPLSSVLRQNARVILTATGSV